MQRQQQTTRKATKDRILQVAEDLFAEKGFEGTGIDEIARKTGISKSVIYYHFKNKQLILDTLMERYLAEALRFKEQAIKKLFPEPERNLREVLRSSLDFTEKRKRIITIILMESLKGPNLRLFDYVDISMEEGFRLFQRESGKEIKNRTELLLRGFFMGFMPLLSFVAFKEKFCEHYDLTEEEVREKFVSMYGELYLRSILQEME